MANDAPKTDWLIRALMAARLAAAESARPKSEQRKDLQAFLADTLKTSQATVSRSLDFAIEQGWLERRLIFHPEKCDAKFLADAESLLGDDDLRDKLKEESGGRLRRLIKIAGTDDATFFPRVQEVLVPLLREAKKVGVTWGYSLSRCLKTMEKRRDSLEREDISFFPVVGEPFLSQTSQDYCSSLLAEKLHDLLSTRKELPPSIAGVRTFVPGTFTEQLDILREFIAKGAGYRKIFLDDDALIRQADTFITATGVPGSEPREFRGIFINDRLEQRDLNPDDVQYLLGDLAGLLIPKLDAPPDIRAKIEQCNDRLLGLKRSHLEECARRETDMPGVVVIARNKNRLELLDHLIRHEKLINTLVISFDLATALKDMLESRANLPLRSAQNH